MADGYINDGTATATAGSKTVTFAGVSVSLFRAGWPFNQGGASGTIASLDSDANTATLVDNWGGDTSSAAAYTVLTIPSSRVLAETTTRWLEYLNGPILSIAQMMDADAPSDGEMLVWDTAGWVATDVFASPTITGTMSAGILNQTVSAGTYQTLNSTGANGAIVDFQNSGADYAYFGSSKILVTGGALGNFAVRSDGALDFAAGGAAISGRFGSDGSWLVGTTSNGGWNGNSRSAVEAASVPTAFSAYNAMVNSEAGSFRVDDTGSVLISFWYGDSTQISYWTTNGSTSTFNNPSDERLKMWDESQVDYRVNIRNLEIGGYRWTNGIKAQDFGARAQQAYEAFAGTPMQGIFVTKPANADDAWSVAGEYYGRLALWGVKDIYDLIEAQATQISTMTSAIAALQKPG